MSDESKQFDEEPTSENDFKSPDEKSKLKRSAYKKLKRDLDEDELNSKGTQKLLLNDLDRLEDEIIELKDFRDKYYEADKKFSIINEQLKSSNSNEILYTVAISLGGTIIGLAISLWTIAEAMSIFILLSGIILIIIALFSKFTKK